MAKVKDITGMRSGKLIAVERSDLRGKDGEYKWKCLCDCGNITYVGTSYITGGRTISCGCAKSKPPLNIIHGYSSHKNKEKLYSVWIAMKQRCTNPNDRNYERYGGRGISVCDEWMNDYEVFRSWCLSNGYKQGLDLDRTDNNKGYSPDNCRFITHQRNLLNTHRKLHDVINGEDITLRDAADKYGLLYSTIYSRYKRGKKGNELIKSNNAKNTNKFAARHEKKFTANHLE